MKLLTAKLRAQLPSLYSQEKNKDPTVHIKFFCPWNNWTEGEPNEEDFCFFGYVCGHEEGWGYFVLLAWKKSGAGRPDQIERDIHSRLDRSARSWAQHHRERGH
ncbi:MAG: DUF2958 domain-containing protein [Acidobacteriota bacterium]|nr:DUF2958 domain-containing protein [Acidobacteriota bacterium]